MRKNRQGLLEERDEDGNILWVQKPPKGNVKVNKAMDEGDSLRVGPKHVHQVIDPSGKKVWVQKGLNPENLPKVVWPFSETTADHICQKITEGYTLQQIGQMEGYPPTHVIYSWSRKYKHFKEEMQKSKKDRAEFFHDMALQTAMETTKKSQVGINKLKVNTLQWAAEKGNPHEFGKTTSIKGDPDQPVKIVIDTGIKELEYEENP